MHESKLVSGDCNTEIIEFVMKWMRDVDAEAPMMRELFDIVEDEATLQRREGFLKGRRSVLRKPNEFLNQPKGDGK